MGDAGGPGSARKCPGVALADLGDTEGFDKGGEEGQLYAFKLSDGMYKRKKVTTREGGGAQKLGELSDVDVSYAVPRRLHQLAFTGSKWVAFADPTQQMGWLIDIRRSFARLQAQTDQRACAKRTWGLHQSLGATSCALYLGGGGESGMKLNTAFWISARSMLVQSSSKG